MRWIKSFLKILNITGHNMEPCGTPLCKSAHDRRHIMTSPGYTGISHRDMQTSVPFLSWILMLIVMTPEDMELYLPTLCKDIYRHSFMYMGGKLWNISAWVRTTFYEYGIISTELQNVQTQWSLAHDILGFFLAIGLFLYYAIIIFSLSKYSSLYMDVKFLYL